MIEEERERNAECSRGSCIIARAVAGDPLRASGVLNDLTILPIGTDIDWQYRTTNEMNACLSTGGSCSWPRGKNLGGSSVHNGMMYSRGHAKDFDNWVAMGNIGWSWRDVRSFTHTRIQSV